MITIDSDLQYPLADSSKHLQVPSLLIIFKSLNRRETRGRKQVLEPAMNARSQDPALMATTASFKALRLELQAVSE